MATYIKLRTGAWGVRGTGLQPGKVVTVTKRDGSSKSETIGTIVWTAPDGVQLASIQPSASTGAAPRRRLRADGTYECEECGDYVRPGSSCWETGMRH